MASTPVAQLPEITKTEFWTFTPKARETFLAKTRPFSSNLPQGPTHFEHITLPALLEYIQKEEASFLHVQQPSILHNARDLSQPYESLGIDTRALRIQILTSFERYKSLPKEVDTVQKLYDMWAADYAERERRLFVRKETTDWEIFNHRQTSRADLPADLLRENQWCDYESAFLGGVHKRLEELRDWESRKQFPKVWERTSVRADQLPKIEKTEFWTFSSAAIKKFLEVTRPLESHINKEDAEYVVTHLTKDKYIEYLKKQSIFADARPDILKNAQDASKPYASLGIDTAKTRIWLHTALDRLAATPEKSLAEIYRQWVADIRAREQQQYVRSELISWEHHLDPKAHEKASWHKEADWAKEEGAFLDAVATRLNEIRNLNEPLLSQQKAAEEDAKREEKKRLQEEKRKAEEAEKKKREEEERLAAQKAKEAVEAQRKREEEEREKKIEEQKAAAQAQVGAVQNKMAMYQAEMAQLQAKMMKGEIDGATFGASIAALSKKYF